MNKILNHTKQTLTFTWTIVKYGTIILIAGSVFEVAYKSASF